MEKSLKIKTIKIDSKWPNENALKTITSIKFVFLNGDKEQPQNKTKLYAYTNNGYLTLFFQCFDVDMQHLVYSETGQDGAIWQDDNIEIYFDSQTKGQKNISFNPIGAFYDNDSKQRWDLKEGPKTKILKDRWEALINIPLKEIITDLDTKITANFSRTRYGRNGTFSEDTAWQQTNSMRANVNEMFGQIIFDRNTKLEVENTELVDLPQDHDTLKKLEQYFKNTICQQVYIAKSTSENTNNQINWEGQIIKNLETLDGRIDSNLQKTTFQICHNNKDLFIKIDCFDNTPQAIKSNTTTKKNDLWQEDSIELFLSPKKKSDRQYLHLTINASNNSFIEWGKGRKDEQIAQPPKFESSIERNQTGYFVSIIFKDIFSSESFKDINLFGFNITRNRPNKPAQPSQSSSWSQLNGFDYHTPSNFGVLYIAKPNKINSNKLQEIMAIIPKNEIVKPSLIDPEIAKYNFDFLKEIISENKLKNQTLKYFKNFKKNILDIKMANWAKVTKDKKWDVVQKEWRENFINSLGGLPTEKSPLNSKTTLVFDGEHYSIYNVLYQSMPKHYVTANLYIPKSPKRDKHPTIVRLIGHSTAGKNNKGIIDFADHCAKNGYVILVIDSLGQGERIYIRNGVGSRTPTSNHYAMGMPGILVKDHIARYFIWDVIRGIDYLLERNDVDPTKIILTGSSGGGTITSYVAALDTRVAGAASVSAMGNDFNRTGSHDTEQMLIGLHEGNFDSHSRAALVAPRPYTIIGEYNDEQSLKNNLEMMEKVHQAYSYYNAEDKFIYTPTEFKHSYNQNHRQVFYTWVKKYFPSIENQSTEESKRDFNDIDSLHVTKSWKVYYSPETSNNITLHQMFKNKMLKSQKNWLKEKAGSDEELKEKITNLKSILRYDEPIIEKIEDLSTEKIKGLTIQKMYVKTKDITIPALLLPAENETKNQKIILWLNDKGKDATLKIDFNKIFKKTKEGYTICIPDISGTGELAFDNFVYHYSFETDMFAMGLTLDKPYLGYKINNAHAIFKALQSKYPNAAIHLYANSYSKINSDIIRQDRLVIDSGLEQLHIGEVTSSVVALSLASIEKEIKSLTIENGLSSYASIYNSFYFYIPVNTFVVGLLEQMDLPDIAQTIYPRPLTIINPVNSRNQKDPNELNLWQGVIKKYSDKKEALTLHLHPN